VIYLDTSRQKFVDALDIHYNSLLAEVKARILLCPNPLIIDFLSDDVIEIVLKGNPKKLVQIQMLLLRQTIPNFSYREWKDHFRLKKRLNTRTALEVAIVTKYSTVYVQLNNIFDYDKYFSKKTTAYSTYDLANNLDINTCTYCNRLYTKTVIKPNKITRPEFDHWFPKSVYPLLALSFYNLIPSCNICNSTVKGSSPMTLKTHLHPYIDKPQFKFSYYNKTHGTYSFTVASLPGSKSANTVNAFKIKEIYEMHEDEIKDLRKIRDTYSDRYLAILASQFTGLAISEDEIYRLAFGTYNDEDFFDKRPLSRMKRDILLELGIIK
jgi:hypothetical protein